MCWRWAYYVLLLYRFAPNKCTYFLQCRCRSRCRFFLTYFVFTLLPMSYVLNGLYYCAGRTNKNLFLRRSIICIKYFTKCNKNNKNTYTIYIISSFLSYFFLSFSSSCVSGFFFCFFVIIFN